jgi:hypothetical protein
MTEERRKLLLPILVYAAIIAVVAFVLFHQKTVKQRLTERPFSGPNPLRLPSSPLAHSDSST